MFPVAVAVLVLPPGDLHAASAISFTVPIGPGATRDKPQIASRSPTLPNLPVLNQERGPLRGPRARRVRRGRRSPGSPY